MIGEWDGPAIPMAVSETAGGSVGSFGDRALSGDRWEDPWPKMARALKIGRAHV